MPNKSEVASLWHDETVHPCSTAMTLAMQAVGADMALVSEWQGHVTENYEAGDWISYGDYLEVELEIALDNMTSIRVHDAVSVLEHSNRLVREIAKASGTASEILQKCTGQRYLINRDDPSEGTDIHHWKHCPVHPDAVPHEEAVTPLNVSCDIPGAFYVQLEVAEEQVKVVGWKFIPSGSDAGFFGQAAHVAFVRDSEGGDVSRGEQEGMVDFLNPNAVDGPLWRAIQETLSDACGNMLVRWEE